MTRCGASEATTASATLSKETKKMNLSTNASTCRRGGLLAGLLAAATLLIGAVGAVPAAAEFGFSEFDVRVTEADATPNDPRDDPPATQAGSHPFALTTYFEANFAEVGPFEFIPDEEVRDLVIEQMSGFSGNGTLPACSLEDFNTYHAEFRPFQIDCGASTAVGVAAISIALPASLFAIYVNTPIYNLEPPAGVAARVGFVVLGVPQIIDIGVKQAPDHNIVATSERISQILAVFGGAIQLWGVPADPIHDSVRGECLFQQAGTGIVEGEFNFAGGGIGESCPSDAAPEPFLNLPTDCSGPLETHWEADSWTHPGKWIEGSVITHDNAEPPNSIGFTGCGKVPFDPAFEIEPSSKSAESPTGLDVNLDFEQEGLTSPDGIAQSVAKKVVATLPDGVTINPSVGEGLGFCSPADYTNETIDAGPGEGCPNESKIGSAEAQSPLLDVESIEGSLYLAQQGDPGTAFKENPFDSLIAVYLVLRNVERGIFVKIPMKVEPDPSTGRLVTTVDNIPKLPVNHFNLHFREGKRSPLTTPTLCGSYDTVTQLYPWSDPDSPVTSVSTFEITSGIGGAPCPPGGVPPFNPDFEAGSINNNAGSYSPFVMRLIRHDGEQDMTKFGSILPPGVVGNLSGVEKCSEAAIATARAKTGREELASASCPANSQIGTTLAGAGVGPALTYVPGKVYLAGPYKGAPLSVVSVTPAVAGPFDAGDVVVRIALNLDPTTAEVIVDGESSDPIPHILKGIPLKVRDLRVYIDRQNFILNPTSCDESSAKATLFGANLDLFSDADDVPANLSTRYQAANCLNLGFNPKLGLKLKGGTKRGNFPGLKAHYKPTEGHANVSDLVVRLPRSAFLEQGHIRTICTRVQFAADNCPKAAQYGYIRAWTPLLDEPLQGPVWLRSSNHKLPDLVFDLKGIVDVEVQTRIDSVNGGIRARVENAPDAPISRVILNMQGGRKGLIVNSRNLCTKRKARANVKGTGQNGKQFTRRPVLRSQCGKQRRAKRSSHSRVSRVAGAGVAG